MSSCDDTQRRILELQQENQRLADELAANERLRRAGTAFTKAEVGEQVILPGRNGTVRTLDPTDINRGFQDIAGRMAAPDVQQFVDRGIGDRARPVGADGEWLNFDRILQETDIQQTRDYALLSRALGLQWEEMNPADYAFVTETYGKERMAEVVARAYSQFGVTMNDVMSRLANDAAGFTGLVEKMARIRLVADRSKKGYLDALTQMDEFMGKLPGAVVPDALKQEAFRSYKLALLTERHHAYARRRTAQTLRSLQEDMGEQQLVLDFVDTDEAQAPLALTPKDIGADEHLGRVIQAVDDGAAGHQQLKMLITAAKVDALDPTSKLGKNWFNTQMRISGAWAKDSQLNNLNTQLKMNLVPNMSMTLYGPLQETLTNGLRTYRVGTKSTKLGLIESAKIHSEAAQQALAMTRATLKEDMLDVFYEGNAKFSTNADLWGTKLPSNEQEMAEAMAVIDMPYEMKGGPLNPINVAIWGRKLQVATRQALGKALPNVAMPWRPALRALAATDEPFAKFHFYFHLRANLEVRARMEGAQLGLLDETTRAQWVEARMQEAIYQATPTESNIKALRQQMGLRGSEVTDDELIAMISENNLAGSPTLSTPESRAAQEYSKWARFQNKPMPSEIPWAGGLVQKVDEGVQSIRSSWVGDTLIPYWRSPTNALLLDHRLSSFALLDTIKVLTAKDPSPQMVARVKSNWIISGSLLSLFAVLDATGNIDGGTAEDPRMRNRIMGIPYLGGIPFLNTLFLWKDVKDAAEAAASSNFDGDEMMAGVMQVLTSQIMRQTGISTLQGLIQALTDANKGGWEKFMRTVAFVGSGQIPMIGPIRQAQRLTGTEGVNNFLDGEDTPTQKYLTGEDDPIEKVKQGLRRLAYETLPILAQPTGAPRKMRDWLGSPLGHIAGVDLARSIPLLPLGTWPNDKVYDELDAQDKLDPPRPLVEKRLRGVGMSDKLQAEFTDIYSTVKGESIVGRFDMAGKSVQVRFPMPVEAVGRNGVRIRKDGGAKKIALQPFLEKHVKGKTVIEAMRSLFNDPIYQAMEDDPLQSADLSLQDQPKVLRRTRPAQQLIQGLKDYYQLLTEDELEKRAAAGTSTEAKLWSDTLTEMSEEVRKRSQEELDPGRRGSWLQKLVEAVN
jgi:hypothetical protein